MFYNILAIDSWLVIVLLIVIKIDISLIRHSFLTIFSQKQSFFSVMFMCCHFKQHFLGFCYQYRNFLCKFSNNNNIINSPFRICIKVDKLL